ncbi:hypothetical protein K9K77_02410 [Candidatus Babeliales bacterium]|nr:hypothetical protein [Candidatus Babeliales bacterium]
MKKVRHYFVFVLLLLTGCVHPPLQEEKKEPLVCNTNNVSSASLILSSDQVVNLNLLNSHLSSFAFSEETFDSLFLDPQSCEARLTDISIPLLADAQMASCSLDGAGMHLLYKTVMPITELISFYKKEMEQSGWEQDFIFEGNEILMVYKKPCRFCVISLRPTKKTWFKSRYTFLSVLTGVS